MALSPKIQPETKRKLKAALALRGETLQDAARRAGLDYGRTRLLVNGYARPRPGELERLAAALDEGGRHD